MVKQLWKLGLLLFPCLHRGDLEYISLLWILYKPINLQISQTHTTALISKAGIYFLPYCKIWIWKDVIFCRHVREEREGMRYPFSNFVSFSELWVRGTLLGTQCIHSIKDQVAVLRAMDIADVRLCFLRSVSIHWTIPVPISVQIVSQGIMGDYFM